MNRVLLAVAAASLALGGSARAEVKTKRVEYSQGGTKLQGFVAWDDAAKGKRPGVLVVHEWWGENEHARQQAIRLAKAGYVGFALDMYGEGKVATHPDDAKKFVQEATKDPQVVKARFEAALAALKKQPQVDPTKIAAVGYCFGGGVALSMARAGEPLRAVAVFHPAIPQPGPVNDGKVTKHIFIGVGAADPMVPKDRVEEFAKEMKAAGADVDVQFYPNAKHSFTNPDAGKAGMDALAYDANADKESWDEAMKTFRAAFES